MARPAPSTPSRQLVFLLRALVGWIQLHQPALAVELGDGPLHNDAEALAIALATAEATLLQERKEDKDVTTRRDATLGKGVNFYRSLQASAKLALGDHPQRDAILGDLHFKAPSSLSTLRVLSLSLQQLSTGLHLHSEALAEVPRYPDWLARTEQLRAALDSLAEAAAREAIETRAAQEARDHLRADAFNLINRLYLAAQAVTADSPATLTALKGLIQSYTNV